MRYWLSRGGQPEGPFEEARIVDMIRGGQVDGGAQVAAESGGGWQGVSAVGGFAQALSARASGQAASPVPHAAMAATMGAPMPSPLSGPGPMKGLPLGNPMVAGTMAMDSASLMQALQSSAGQAQAPAYSPPPSGGAPFGGAPFGSAPGGPGMGGAPMGAPQGGPGQFGGYGSAHGSAPGAAMSPQFSAPSHYAPPAAPAAQKNNLPIMIGCGVLAAVFLLCSLTSLLVAIAN